MSRSAQLVTLDRVQFLAEPSDRGIPPQFAGFKRLRDWFVRSQTSAQTYRRVAEYVNLGSGTRFFLQYQPTRLPSLAPFKGTLVPHDQCGLSSEEIRQVVGQFKAYRFLLIEVAFDFPPGSGIDVNFVRKFGVFGKSRPNHSRLLKHGALLGLRKGSKLIRVYNKSELDVLRVEVELHSAWLRRFGVATLRDTRKLPQALFPRHFRFVNINWMALRKHLSRRGMRSGHMIQQAKDRSDSIHAVMELLRNSGVHNPHRFLLTVAPSREIFQALKNWARTF
jgi:hypothetical protein